MSFRFIAGGSGSGKTDRAFSELIESSLKNPNKTHWVIVPEQYTMQSQKRVMLMHKKRASANIDVLSFKRLAYKIFAEMEMKNLLVVDDVAKAMIIRKIASYVQQDLGIWKHQFSKVGFVDQVKSLFSEFYQYGITPEQIRALYMNEEGGVIRGVLKEKLKDIDTVYSAFVDFMRDKMRTAEEIPEVLSRLLPSSNALAGAKIVLDGFTGFSPVQYRIIESFLRFGSQVSFTLTADSPKELYDVPGEADLFRMSGLIAQKVRELAEKNGVIHEEDIFLSAPEKGRFKNAPALLHLERNLFRDGQAKKIASDGKILITAAKNPEEEIVFLTNRVLFLVKSCGFRYRDIAVITQDIPAYRDFLEHRFAANHIPLHVDENRNLNKNILVELLRAVIDLAREEYSYESLIRYLRSPLLGKEETMCWQFDNYVYEFGIRGLKKMRRVWSYDSSYQKDIHPEEMNRLREEILSETLPLYKILRRSSVRPKKAIEAVRNFFLSLNVEEKLLSLAEKLTREGASPQLIQEYTGVYEKVWELLEQMEIFLEDETLSLKEFSDFLEAGLSQIQLGTIPDTADRVLFGDITRTRMDEAKVLFVIGANEGIIPLIKDTGGIFHDRDKGYLKAAGLELAPTMKEDVFIQRFYLYSLLTKAAESLYISFSLSDESGRKKRPAYFISPLCSLFSDVWVEPAGRYFSLHSLYEGKEFAAEFIRTNIDRQVSKKGRRELFAKILPHVDTKPYLKAAMKRYEPASIGKEAAKRLFGNNLYTGVTRLERYADCPYAFFADNGIHLRERPAYRIGALDIGSLVHDVLDISFRSLLEKEKSPSELLPSERERLVEESIARSLLSPDRQIYRDGARNAYIMRRLKELGSLSLWALSSQLSVGDFSVYASELSFSAGEQWDALRIPISDGRTLFLNGKIDRVDIANREKEVFVKINDYKTGSASWDWDAIYMGRQMQMIVYMETLLEKLQQRFKEKRIIPAAMLYYKITEPFLEEEKTAEEEEKGLLKLLRPQGLVNREKEILRALDRSFTGPSIAMPVYEKKGEIEHRFSNVASEEEIYSLMQFVRKKLRQRGKEILDGKFNVSPLEYKGVISCTYCPYKAVCGFDRKSPGYGIRRTERLSDEEFWKRVQNEKERE